MLKNAFGGTVHHDRLPVILKKESDHGTARKNADHLFFNAFIAGTGKKFCGKARSVIVIYRQNTILHRGCTVGGRIDGNISALAVSADAQELSGIGRG